MYVASMGITVTGFTGVEQTAFLTVYARALDCRWQRPILDDTLAQEIIGKIDYDFAAFDVPTTVVAQQALRAKMLDDRVRDFTARHPDAVVADLGAGLSSAMFRVAPPATVDWYDVDLPQVIALREQVVPNRDRAHSVAASFADDHWTDAIPADRPTMLIADGLLPFIAEPIVINLFRHITEHFRCGELAFNDYGRVGLFSRLSMKLAPQGMFSAIGSQWKFLGFKDPHVPETWNPRLTLAEEASLAHAPEVDLFPRRLRASMRLGGRFKAFARKARILRYRFG